MGVAAVLKREGKPDCILKLHLGTTKQHTVYEAELVGMIMSLYLLKMERRSRTKCSLSVDNHTALNAIKSKMNKSGQHLVARLLQLAKQLIEKQGSRKSRLTFRWSAGHIGIEGNEDADKVVKTAADGESSDKLDLPPCLRKMIGHSLSAIQQTHNKTLKLKWTTAWINSLRFQHCQFKDLLTLYSQRYIEYISNADLSRNSASMVFQLRVGHAPLNHYLYRFKKVDSVRCPACSHLKETPEHFLLHCPKYVHECWPILSTLGGRPPKLAKLLSSPKLLLPLANFIEATEQFKSDLNQTRTE